MHQITNLFSRRCLAVLFWDLRFKRRIPLHNTNFDKTHKVSRCAIEWNALSDLPDAPSMFSFGMFRSAPTYACPQIAWSQSPSCRSRVAQASTRTNKNLFHTHGCKEISAQELHGSPPGRCASLSANQYNLCRNIMKRDPDSSFKDLDRIGTRELECEWGKGFKGPNTFTTKVFQTER